MPSYEYKARDKSGRSIKGVIVGENKESVARNLQSFGHIPISITEVKYGSSAGKTYYTKKVNQADLNTFTKLLYTLQHAGLPLLGSLNAIAKQLDNVTLKAIVKEIVQNLESGSSLSVAMEKYPRVFNPLYVSMIRAGEAGGVLDEMLNRLSDLGERELDTQRKMKTATRYPILVFGAMAIAFFIVTAFVIPKFAGIFSSFKAELPLPTRILMGLSMGIRHYWYLIVGGIAGIVVGCQVFVRTHTGKMFWDMTRLKIPVIGNLILILTLARLTKIMAILVKSGLPILHILEMVAKTLDDEVISKAMGEIAQSVKEGKGLAEPMQICGIFPPIVVQMVSVGEETGKLDELLEKVSEYFNEKADYVIENLAVLIEPIFITMLGAMVLVMALAIFLPMWNLSSVMKSGM